MSPQAGYILEEQIAPRLRIASRRVPQIGADDADELYQDGLATAAQMLDSAERNGRSVTAGNIAWYAGKRMAAGRRSTYGGRADVLSPAAQLDGNAQLSSLQQEVASDPETGEGILLGDLLTDSAEDPALAAARNLDWETFKFNGSTVLMEPSDDFWGERFARVRDPFGHEWGITTLLREMSADEIQAAAEQMFADMSEQ